ncbi:MAG: hypothetical protein M1820_009385 [Bogoriella megaspora]|nr:MAG: hypothetical protein M1820_009385 [Bogoriella megaspora]
MTSISHTEYNDFERLVAALSDILGPSSGINSADVDPEEIQELMRNYVSRESEWRHFAIADSSVSYTRNLVDSGNGKSNLLILVWNPGRGSPVHDHADSHCIMKILKGSLKETLYSMPDPVKSPGPLTIKKETIYGEGEVTYMSDDLGLHRVSNPHPTELAVSVHLYTPPNAAKHGFHIFNAETGKATACKQGQYTTIRGVSPRAQPNL